jgi:oligopeptide transport system substrate-binding protein
LKKFFVSTLLVSLSGLALLFATSNNTHATVKQEINTSAIGKIASLDSTQTVDTVSADVLGDINEGLYRLNKSGNPELGLAKEKPKVSADKLTYTYTLRKSYWSNGTPVTAQDFVYAFKSTISVTNFSHNAHLFTIFKNGTEISNGLLSHETLGVTALDTNTLQLELAHPIPNLPQILAGTHFLPQNQQFVEQTNKKYGTSAATTLCNGPFQIKKWSADSSTWTLVKNTHYWDRAHVRLQTIHTAAIANVGTSLRLFDTGELDFTRINGQYVSQKADYKEEHVVDKSLIGYLVPNNTRSIMNNKNVRQAILQAIDKQKYIDTVLDDGSKVLNGLIPRNFANNPVTQADFRTDNGNLLPHNVKKAKKAWAQAQRELGQDKIEIELLVADTTTAKNSGLFLKEKLEDTLPGLTIRVKSVSLQERIRLQNIGMFDLAYCTWTASYADPSLLLNAYASTSGTNAYGQTGAKYDRWLKKMAVATDNNPETRWNAMLAAEKELIQNETIVLPLYQGVTAYMQATRLHGVTVFPVDRTASYRLAYVK